MRRRLLACSLLLALGGAAPAAAAPEGSPAVVASGLDTPWDVVPLTGGRTLVTERPGRIRVLAADGTLQAAPVYADPTARKFLGLEPDPGYAQNGLLYLYVSRESGSSVVRLRDDGTRLTLDRVVFPGPIATDGNHDGGRMRFGPDGKLYVTTGDIHQPQLPQDLQSLNGKVLRMNADGSPPADNPFFGQGGNASYVWSYGHRHPQGLAWDDRGRLWETEHGPSGEQYDPVLYAGGAGRCCRDELNLIVKGGNYGWPVVSGDDQRSGMIAPVAHAGSERAWAPGGLAFAGDGKLYAPMLAGQHLREFTLDAGNGVSAQRALYPGVRLRAASYDACRGALWFTGDGGSTTLQRVAIGLEGRPAPPCGPPVGPLPGPGAPPPAAAPSPLPPRTVPGAAPSSGLAVAVERFAARGRAAVRAAGTARLTRGGRVLVRGGGFGAGKLTVRLGLRSGDRLRSLTSVSREVAGRSTVTVPLRLGASARRVLRRASRPTLVVTVGFRPRAGGNVVRSASARVPLR